MYLNICHDAPRRSWQGFLCTCWGRMMKTVSVNYIMSQVMRLNPKFPGLRSQEKSWPAQSGADLQNPLDLCCFSQALFFSPLIYIFIRADRSLTSFNFFFFPPTLSASRERTSSNVPCGAARDFGRWEICWGSTLISKCGHKFCLCRFHSLIVTYTPPPSARPPPSYCGPLSL